MKAQASIEVQFKPFRLTVMRTPAGGWTAVLARIGHDDAPPLVVAVSDPSQPRTAARIDTARIGGQPGLWIGGASFDMPTRQLKRIGEWIDAQNAPVVPAGDAEP